MSDRGAPRGCGDDCSVFGKGLDRWVAVALLACGVLASGRGALAAAPFLSGVWMPDPKQSSVTPVSGATVPLTAAGKAMYAKNQAALQARAGKPVGRNDLTDCLPYGPTRILQQPFPVQLVQKGDIVSILYEHNHVWELIYLNEKQDPDADLRYMGNSVGSWSADGLTIGSQGFKEGSYLDNTGLPHSDQLSLTRVIREVAGGKKLEIDSTITDPMMYSHSWTVRQMLDLRSDLHIEDYVCGQGPVLDTRYTH